MKRLLSTILIFAMLFTIMPNVVYGAKGVENFEAEVASEVKTATIEVGDYVQLGTYNDEPIVWRCVDVDENGPLMLSDKIIAVKPYDAATGENSEDGSHSRSDKRDKGSNYWEDSNLRSWLNSSDSAGNVEWLCGNAPSEEFVYNGMNEYANEAGFLNGFTTTEKSLIKTVTQKCIIAYPEISEKLYTSGNSRMENNFKIVSVIRNYDSAYATEVTDKIFLLDEKQISTVYNNGDVLGSSYYIGKFTEKALENSEYDFGETGTDVEGDYWLRSAGSDYESYVRYVSNGGSVGNYDAYSCRVGVRPAFYSVNSSISYGSGNGSEENPYIFAELSEDAEYPYVISEAYFNADGNTLTVNLEYIGKNVQSAKLIAASYDENNAIINTVINDVNGAGQLTFEFEKNEGDFVRLYVWKDMTSITPLSEVVVPTQKTSNVTKLEGKVIANSITTLDYPKSIDTSKEAEVTIDVTYNYNSENNDFKNLGSYKFNVAETDAESYLGLAVVFTVKKNAENEYDIISIEPKSGKNDKVEFTLDKFYDAEVDYIDYLANVSDANTTRIKIQNNANIIYNNIGGTFTFEELFVSGDIIAQDSSLGGKVTFYDTDTTTGYDLIFVEIAAYGVVEDVYNDIIVFKNDVGVGRYLNAVSKIYVDEEYTDYIVNITKGGKMITADEIKENDVLSIITNNESEVYEIEVLSDKNIITGKVSATSLSSTSCTGYSYMINGNQYDIADGAYHCDNIKLATSGIFYIDPYGKIIALIEDALDLPVAYVLGTATNGNGFAPEIQFKLLTEEQGIVIYDVASTVTINDEYYEEENDIDAILELISEGSVIIYQASGNEIESIILPGYDDEGFQEVRLSYLIYDAADLRFGNKHVDENTKVFFVSDDEESMGVGTINNLIDEVNYVDALAFVMDEDWEALDVIVIRDSIAMNTGKSSANVIIDIQETLNKNNEPIFTIEYLENGELKTVNSTKRFYNSVNGMVDINKGDICKFAINVNGLLSDIMLIVDFEDGIREKYDSNGMAAKLYYDFSDYPASDEEFIITPVLAYKTSTNTIELDGVNYKLANAENVYVIDPSSDA